MHSPRSDRGQTALDFVTGVALFLLAVAFVIAFVPSMFAPFFGTNVGDAMVADRSAAYLVETELVDDPSTPGTLNGSEVADFFDSANCTDDPGDHLSEVLGVRTTSINVSIDGDPDWACGDVPQEGDTVSTRIVTVDGQQHILRVVVW